MVLFGIIMLAIGCTKVDKVEDLGGAGQTLVKLPSDKGFHLAFVELKSTTQTINLLELRRDIPNEGELNKTMKVTLKEDPALVATYNSKLPAGATPLTLLPEASYTPDPANPKAAGVYTVTFGPGEFAKQVRLTFPNATNLNPNNRYGQGYVLASVDQNGKISKVLFSTVVEVSVKNQYDGDYQAKGTFHHPVNGPRAIDEPKALTTTGPSSVLANLGDLGSSNYKMILTVGADNKVTITPAGITPNIDQTWGDNYYDPADQSFHLHYSYNTAAPRIIEEVIKRK